MAKRLVIYHANCIDGFTAAWAAWCAFGDDAQYMPAKYGDGAPVVNGLDVTIVDFSYPRDALLAMEEQANSLLVLDHHKTAQADLEGLNFCTFDMGRSGAGLAWDVLKSGVCRPPLINYVEDRDLWRFALPCSKEINAFIGTFEQTFGDWSLLDHALEDDFGGCAGAGGAVLRGVDRYCREMAEHLRFVQIGQHIVPCVNAPYINTSELVGHLAETHSRSPFAAGWFQRGDGQYQYSLRSRGDFDVSAVAKLFGGGGHKNAAGFVVGERVHS